MLPLARRRRVPRGWMSRRRCCCFGTKICVTACSGTPVIGALVSIYTGSTLIDSCTTGSTGCCTLPESGSYTLKATISGTVEYSATRTLAGTTITVALASGSGLICCGGYMIPMSLTLTDAAGSLSFVYNGTGFYPTWYGGHAVTKTSCTVTTTNNTCVPATANSGPVRVCYQMMCFAGSSPTFALQRSWSWVYDLTSTPIWYQDPSGFTPGAVCGTAPPAVCGSPHTDLASVGANPTTANPFAWSGTPVAAGGNATADPVGGSVAIS